MYKYLGLCLWKPNLGLFFYIYKGVQLMDSSILSADFLIDCRLCKPMNDTVFIAIVIK